MKSDNLIKGQKPEFGNPDHIKWLKEQSEIMNGEINFGEIDWMFCQYLNGGCKTKPKFRYAPMKECDAIVDTIKCPKCDSEHILLLHIPDLNGILCHQQIIEAECELDKEGFKCHNCGLEMYIEDRMLYVKQNEK